MADNTIKVRLQSAYKTSAQWTSLNPVLKAGEVGYVSDLNNIYKVGDGTSTWSQLPYQNAGGVGNDKFYWQYNESTESVSLIFR